MLQHQASLQSCLHQHGGCTAVQVYNAKLAPLSIVPGLTDPLAC